MIRIKRIIKKKNADTIITTTSMSDVEQLFVYTNTTMNALIIDTTQLWKE